MAHPAPCIVQVAGDPTVDWLLVNPTGAHLHLSYQWDEQATVHLDPQPGGAARITRGLKRLSSTVAPEMAVYGVVLPDDVIFDPRNRQVARSFQWWDRFPRELGSSQTPTWRCREFVGQEHGDELTPYAAGEEPNRTPTVVVLDDTNLGFRQNRAAWPTCLGEDGRELPQHVILRVTNPLATGSLWERLVSLCPDRLSVILSASDLRKEYATVGQALSWERSSVEVAKAVSQRVEFARVARVIVSLGASGAVLVERGQHARLIFDPRHQEGDWEQRRPGENLGVGTCLSYGLTYEAALNPSRPRWVEAIARGLLMAREVHDQGFQLFDADGNPGEGFPFTAMGAALSGEQRNMVFEHVAISLDERWNMFEDAFPEGYNATARRIVVEGEEEACRQLPIERMGYWSSMDRTEIESMRSVRAIMREYVSQPRRTRPLNLAVFGPPGSGKSYAIKQMSKELGEGATPVTPLEFNLSQFSSMDDLPRAFQRVRDCAVEGQLPLVFWDEFDTALGGREMAWLASFLAPMQDGLFNEGGVMRPIGPAIFVFAGGTHPTMASFKQRAAEVPGTKATDFLSRLRGLLDVLGLNPVDETDRTYVLRRASLLRSLLRDKTPQIFRGQQPNIDPGILNAFLHIDAYVHGARSMESVIDMSALSGRPRFERSALPARHQLSLHVDADRFLALVREEAAA